MRSQFEVRDRTQGEQGYGAVHKVRHAILANFEPPPLCHTLSHIPGPPESMSHISDPPDF